MEIRSCRDRDSQALEGLEHECFPDANWTASDFFDYQCLVAEVEGRLAGFVVYHEVFPGDTAHPAEREILNLAVAPGHRRNGVATALISKILDFRGSIYLEVRESNVAAQALYRKLGFVEIGRRPNYYHAPEETAIVMKMK